MGLLEKIVNFFVPTAMSKIIVGPFYRAAALEMYKNKHLVAPAIDLSPAHVNCARVVFLHTQDVILDLEIIAAKCGCTLQADSIVYYGTQGTPILD